MEMDKISPADWKDIVRGRKVIFYNTSVSSMLQNGDRHIKKMEWVFMMFHRHPEVVLWWRPHPLELSTVQSMRPELEQKYYELKQDYKAKAIGILDESSDLHRAIAVSDAYYGDWSSVLQLYKVTEKPVFLANDLVMECNPQIRYFICDFLIVDEDMWFISSLYNGLFRMSLSSFMVTEVIPVPGERVYEQRMMRFLIRAERELFLVPDWGSIVFAYDMDKKKLRILRIGGRTTFTKFTDAYYKDGSLYLFSAAENRQMRIDIHSLSVQMENCKKAKRLPAILDEKYKINKEVNNRSYTIPFVGNCVQVQDSDPEECHTQEICTSAKVRNMLCDRSLFDIYQDGVLTDANPFYAGEQKWVYTLERYIKAVTEREFTCDTDRRRTGLCGPEIYKITIQNE